MIKTTPHCSCTCSAHFFELILNHGCPNPAGRPACTSRTATIINVQCGRSSCPCHTATGPPAHIRNTGNTICTGVTCRFAPPMIIVQLRQGSCTSCPRDPRAHTCPHWLSAFRFIFSALISSTLHPWHSYDYSTVLAKNPPPPPPYIRHAASLRNHQPSHRHPPAIPKNSIKSSFHARLLNNRHKALIFQRLRNFENTHTTC